MERGLSDLHEFARIFALQILDFKDVVQQIKYGIYSVLTSPSDLNVNTINRYLEFKARGMM